MERKDLHSLILWHLWVLFRGSLASSSASTTIGFATIHWGSHTIDKMTECLVEKLSFPSKMHLLYRCVCVATKQQARQRQEIFIRFFASPQSVRFERSLCQRTLARQDMPRHPACDLPGCLRSRARCRPEIWPNETPGEKLAFLVVLSQADAFI